MIVNERCGLFSIDYLDQNIFTTVKKSKENKSLMSELLLDTNETIAIILDVVRKTQAFEFERTLIHQGARNLIQKPSYSLSL